MGLRSRIGARARRAWEGVASRLALSGPTHDRVEERWGRTPAWPPEAIGEGDGDTHAQLHPLDRVRAGLPTIAPAGPGARGVHPDRLGRSHTDPPLVAAEPSATYYQPGPGPGPGPAPGAGGLGEADFDFPWESVPQTPYLPPAAPSARTQGPQDAQRPPVAPAPPELLSEPADEAERARLRDEVVGVLTTIYDPEIPVDIYALGLVYDVEVAASRDVEIRMTLTSPNCPAAQSLPGEVEQKSAAVGGVRSAMVDIVWDPPWSPAMMSEEARLELNIDG
jgi:FeS assembly SUF system protein